ncbi:MAG: biopolymer transporter ExbD [Desulfobacteraceae bacterium]|nr:biopolymer transporter ExbD [Desulfobacteraceae bacterium]MBC2757767.1 biopolymer transporter ExbD [Desulfobacteraceae bacterium]MBC2763873.1 biopolymer transporter ExbD [ANME-2 cluster archaeon]
MLVHKKQRTRYQIQAPLTSLIDIVFMLLIYFLLTTNFMVEQGIDVNLPDAKASAPQTRKEITVYINAAGMVYMGNQPIAFNDLFDRLQERIRENPEQLVVIKADGDIILDRAVQVMDIAQAAGAQKLFLATEKGSGSF